MAYFVNKFSFLQMEREGKMHAKQKSVLLLHSAEMHVQEIFATLTDPGPTTSGKDNPNMCEKARRINAGFVL